jgi:hypothetical protein
MCLRAKNIDRKQELSTLILKYRKEHPEHKEQGAQKAQRAQRAPSPLKFVRGVLQTKTERNTPATSEWKQRPD